jgi:hypothetical protein
MGVKGWGWGPASAGGARAPQQAPAGRVPRRARPTQDPHRTCGAAGLPCLHHPTVRPVRHRKHVWRQVLVRIWHPRLHMGGGKGGRSSDGGRAASHTHARAHTRSTCALAACTRNTGAPPAAGHTHHRHPRVHVRLQDLGGVNGQLPKGVHRQQNAAAVRVNPVPGEPLQRTTRKHTRQDGVAPRRPHGKRGG